MNNIRNGICIAILAVGLASGCRTPTSSSPLIGTWHSVRIEGPDSDTLIEQTLSFSEDGSLALVDRTKFTCVPPNEPQWLTQAWATPYETRGTNIVTVLNVDFAYQTVQRQRDGNTAVLLHLTAKKGSNVWHRIYRKLEWTRGQQPSSGDVATRAAPEK